MPGKTEGSGGDHGRLGTELKFYAAHKPEWLKTHSGEFVVVKDRNLLGFYAAWEQAFRAGVAAFGLREDFLVKQVLARDPVYFVGNNADQRREEPARPTRACTIT